MIRTRKQNSELHYLLGQLNIDDEDLKAELVFKFSGGRVTSSANMIVPECQSLINHLKAVSKGYAKLSNDPANRMRRKILAMCHEMRWTDPVTREVDWDRLNAWLLKYGFRHQFLNDYSLADLPVLITQFEQLLKDYYAKR